MKIDESMADRQRSLEREAINRALMARGSSEAERPAHTRKVDGSNPSPATNYAFIRDRVTGLTAEGPTLEDAFSRLTAKVLAEREAQDILLGIARPFPDQRTGDEPV